MRFFYILILFCLVLTSGCNSKDQDNSKEQKNPKEHTEIVDDFPHPKKGETDSQKDTAKDKEQPPKVEQPSDDKTDQNKEQDVQPDKSKNEIIWHTDYRTAVELAKQQKKTLLLKFTGSDWCGPCIRLNNNVIKKDAFKVYARANFVLLLLDFPANKKQSDKQIEHNAKLKTKYKIRGYPTIILQNTNEKVLGSLVGYNGESPTSYIQKLRAIINK